jgi:hypothetical protein
MEPDKNPIDIDKILLPKKEVHSPASAQRINAGKLLEQEQKAELTPAKPLSQKSSDLPSAPSYGAAGQTFAQEVLPAQVGTFGKQFPAEEPKLEEASIRQLQTYGSDIQKVVEEKKVSIVSIAAAEAARRSAGGGVPEKKNTKEDFLNLGKRVGAIAGGVALVVVAGAMIFFAVSLFRPTSPNAGAPLAPFILVDATQSVPVASGEGRAALMQSLVQAKQAVYIALGLVERLYLNIDAQVLLTAFAPNIPQDLLRTVQPTYLLGVHSFDGNQPFLILSVDVYQQGYSGMLLWEQTMLQDLAPLFTYAPHLSTTQINNPAASSTPAAPEIIQTGFTDAIVENHDARVAKNDAGDIVLLWTFLDRSTLVITTNENTLREVIVRLKNAPIISTN